MNASFKQLLPADADAEGVSATAHDIQSGHNASQAGQA
jgi:hypothetical protein